MTLPLFELDDWFAQTEGKFEYSLSHSGCQPIAAAEFLGDQEIEALLETPLGYGVFEGLKELRTAVALRYQSISPENVITFNGPSEAIYTFMRASMKPGNRIVVPKPLFHPLHSIARHIGCEMIPWHARDEIKCTFDVNDLERICDPTVDLIVINFPHNPTGQTISEEQLRQIANVARKSDAMVFSDEVFRLLELPPYATLPAICDVYEKGVSVTGLSKPYGLGGLRIGWMATRYSDVHQLVKQYRYNTAEMTNTPCQWLACRALRETERIVQGHRSVIMANLDRLVAFADSHDGLLELHPPQAGTMAVVRQKTPWTSTELCQRVLDEERLFMIPGRLVDMSDRLIRVGLGMLDFETGLERFGRFLERHCR